MKFRKGDYVKIKEILYSQRLVSLALRGGRPPERLVGCVGRIIAMFHDKKKRVDLSSYHIYMVRFLHNVDFEERFVQEEKFFFYEKELVKADKHGIRSYCKWEDMLKSKELAEKL